MTIVSYSEAEQYGAQATCSYNSKFYGFNGTSFLQKFGNTLLLLFLSVEIGYSNKKSKINYLFFMHNSVWGCGPGLEARGSTHESDSETQDDGSSMSTHSSTLVSAGRRQRIGQEGCSWN